MKNNIKNLSSFGFSNYQLDTKGRLFKTAPKFKEIKKDSLNRFYLIDDCGKEIRITQKKLYKQVFGMEFCIDEIENLSGEEWKPIENTDNKYFISNYGRVKSYCGYNAIVLKPYLQQRGYLEVKINDKNFKIHQLVANAFCENRYKGTETKTEIHHKNRNKQDNRHHNLIILSVEEHHKEHSKKESIDNE